MNFKDKIILITGAASGIGRAVALAFAKAGGTIVVSDIIFSSVYFIFFEDNDFF